MTFRANLGELALGFVALLMGGIQLFVHEAWPESTGVAPVIPYVAIYWTMIIFGVAMIIHAYRKANN